MHGDLPPARCQRQRDLPAQPPGSAGDKNNFRNRISGVGRHVVGLWGRRRMADNRGR